MSLLITNIKQLIQIRDSGIRKVSGKDMKILPIIENAFVLIENDTIIDFGEMKDSVGVNADKNYRCFRSNCSSSLVR